MVRRCLWAYPQRRSGSPRPGSTAGPLPDQTKVAVRRSVGPVLCDDPAVTNAAGTPVEPDSDLNADPNAPAPFEPRPPALASWSRRVMAALLDGGIGTGLTFLVFGVLSVPVPFVGPAFQLAGEEGVRTPSWTDSGWLVSVTLLLVAMQAYLGATPGKLVIGVAVVGERDARPIGVLRTIVRWLAHLLDSILLIGYLRPLWNPQRKTFADSIMSTVVLETRRPRRHPWLTRGRDRGTDPGPPRSWEAPSAPRWWPAATGVSAVACALGVLFSVGLPPGEASGQPLVLSCTMTTPDRGPVGLTGGALSAAPGNVTTTRLGVTRHGRSPDQQVTASWRWRASLPANGFVTLRASVARADGTVARHYDFPVPEGAVQEATMELPSDALTGLGESWVWTANVLVDGNRSPGCAASSQG